MTATDPELTDGRRRRRKENRDTVIDALIALFDAGKYQPSAQEIAEQAGVSPRSLFRYFDDLDDLSEAAIERLVEGSRPFAEVEIPSSMPLSDRVDLLVEARVRLFETTAAAARAARITAHRRAPVATQLHDSRSFLRQQVSTVFGAELDAGRRHLLPAVDALCSFETYDLLRSSHRLSQKRITDTLRDALRALLESEGSNP